MAAADLREVTVGAEGHVPDVRDRLAEDIGVRDRDVGVARLAPARARVLATAAPRVNTLDGQRVDAEDRAGEVVLHIAVHPFHHGEDRDQEGDPHDHAQKREERFELLGPDLSQGQQDRVEYVQFTGVPMAWRSSLSTIPSRSVTSRWE